jgi:electron transfer flavoprotein alpha subunit
MSRVVVFSEDLATAAGLVPVATALAAAASSGPADVRAVCLDGRSAEVLAGSGATSVVVLDGGTDRPEAYAAPLADLVREDGADLLLVGSTVTGGEVAARVAGALGVALVSGAGALRREDGAWHSERTVYAGAAVQAETWTGLGVVTLAPPRTAPAAAPAAAPAPACPVETRRVEPDTRVRSVTRTVLDRPATDLAGARRVVCVGMGLGSPDALPEVEALAAALGAEVACTRPVAEDREWLGTERYLGISGVSVHPDLYLGLGVSGQVQHSIGFRDARVVVAVNTDPGAPIGRVADHLVVGDLHEIVPLLTAALLARDHPGARP